MSRVQIDLPEEFVFSTRLQVRIGDIVGGLHLGNHILVSYFNEALLLFLRGADLSSENPEGHYLINADLAVVYKSESHHSDVLRFDLAIGEINSHGFDLYQRVTNESTGKDVALAKMALLFFDYESRHLREVPGNFKKYFASHLGDRA